MKSQEKVPKTTENSCYWILLMVPVTGLEPVRHRWRWILSPLRLPFHHTGNCIFKFPLQNRSSENGGQNRRAIQKTLHIHFQKVLVFQGKSHTPEDLANQILSPPRLPIPTHRQIYFFTPGQASPGIWGDIQEGCERQMKNRI